MKTVKWVVFASLAVAASGCSDGEKVDIGEGQPTPPAIRGSELVDYSGTWDGYVEAFRFRDDSDRVRMTLDANGAGTLLAGNDSVLRALSADDYAPAWTVTGEGLPQPGPALMVPGLAYELTKVAVQNLRVQMQTSTLEAFRHWCELLSPVLLDASSDRYACLPQAGTAFENGSCYLVDQAGRSEVACGKLSCTYVCQCEAAGCSVASGPNIPGDIQLDAALSADGSSLTGTMVLPGEVRTTVRLTRQ